MARKFEQSILDRKTLRITLFIKMKTVETDIGNDTKAILLTIYKNPGSGLISYFGAIVPA